MLSLSKLPLVVLTGFICLEPHRLHLTSEKAGSFLAASFYDDPHLTEIHSSHLETEKPNYHHIIAVKLLSCFFIYTAQRDPLRPTTNIMK